MDTRQWKVEATDGWYSVPLTFDSAIMNFISSGKIREGTKLAIHGAELLECDHGFYPLEVYNIIFEFINFVEVIFF